jgi:hypothetical protein
VLNRVVDPEGLQSRYDTSEAAQARVKAAVALVASDPTLSSDPNAVGRALGYQMGGESFGTVFGNIVSSVAAAAPLALAAAGGPLALGAVAAGYLGAAAGNTGVGTALSLVGRVGSMFAPSAALPPLVSAGVGLASRLGSSPSGGSMPFDLGSVIGGVVQGGIGSIASGDFGPLILGAAGGLTNAFLGMGRSTTPQAIAPPPMTPVQLPPQNQYQQPYQPLFGAGGILYNTSPTPATPALPGAMPASYAIAAKRKQLMQQASASVGYRLSFRKLYWLLTHAPIEWVAKATGLDASSLLFLLMSRPKRGKRGHFLRTVIKRIRSGRRYEGMLAKYGRHVARRAPPRGARRGPPPRRRASR